MYVELSTGANHNGPAWICYVSLSKSKRTKYFNGKALKQYSGTHSNHYDFETGEEYWLSGIKKKGTNRHWAGKGKIQVDESAVEEFLEIKELKELDINKYEIVHLNNEVDLKYFTKLENSN